MGKLEFKPKANIRTLVTKFGGAPVWLSDPQWPLSRSTGQPMRFICQIALPKDMQFGGQQMAYVFMTDPEPGEEYVESTWEPEGGENAVVLQPAPFEPIVDTTDLTFGPTLQGLVTNKPPLIDRIIGMKRGPSWQDVEFAVTDTDAPNDPDALGSRLFGEPDWLQIDGTPTGGKWQMLIQIDSAQSEFRINFGDAGMGYAFIHTDGRAARFLWQCC